MRSRFCFPLFSDDEVYGSDFLPRQNVLQAQGNIDGEMVHTDRAYHQFWSGIMKTVYLYLTSVFKEPPIHEAFHEVRPDCPTLQPFTNNTYACTAAGLMPHLATM